MKIKIELDEKLLTDLISDFESGFIANPGARADRRRERYERAIRAAIENCTSEWQIK